MARCIYAVSAGRLEKQVKANKKIILKRAIKYFTRINIFITMPMISSLNLVASDIKFKKGLIVMRLIGRF